MIAPYRMISLASAVFAALVGLAVWSGRQPALTGETAERPAAAVEISPSSTYLRRPSAAAWGPDGRFLFIVNRDSGTVSVLDADKHQVVGEYPGGQRLVDVATSSSGKSLLAVDEAAREVLELTIGEDGAAVAVSQRLPIPGAYPGNVVVLPDGRACVSSVWSRELIFLERSPKLASGEAGPWRLAFRLRLPFAPRLMCWVDDTHLVATDAFAGRVGLVDLKNMELTSSRQLPVHNIRGLAFDGERLWFGCQELNPVAQASFDDIHWGILVDNQIRNLPLEALLKEESPKSVDELIREKIARGDRITLSTQGLGAADPGGLFIEPGGWRVVALSGSHEVAVVSSQRAVLNFVPVGLRPVQVLPRPGARQAYVINQFSDSVSVIDLKTGGLVGKQISLGPMPKLSSKDRGERLFYDGRASHDTWLSCHSCHPDGHSTGGLVDTLGDESYGAPKRVLSLLGVSQTDTWAWNGGIKELHEQVRKSIDSTMHGQPLSAEAVQDMVAYLFTLKPPPPLDPPRTEADRQVIARGQAVFHREGCANCHVPPLTYTTQGAFEVGVADELGAEKFNPPSLLGVGHRDRLLHDNRAAGLESLFVEHGHQLKNALPKQDLADLVRFLRSL